MIGGCFLLWRIDSQNPVSHPTKGGIFKNDEKTKRYDKIDIKMKKV